MECTKCQAMLIALKEIAEGRGPFNRDLFAHCVNTVENMKEIANKAVTEAEKE